jgi:glyoxylase-like metal-dependent hydrolase (beta-lactamase superfamily II)
MTAHVHILHTGYVGAETPAGMHVGSTVTFAESGGTRVIVDPGLVASTDLILDPLRELGLAPEGVTDVVFSHQHIDHTLNAALFPNARYHDFAAIYRGDLWQDGDAEGRVLADGIRLIRTPGHTNEDISTLIETADGLVVCTHAWWFEGGPDEDPYAPDQELLRRSRDRILALEPTLVVPGHGAPFTPQ